MNIPTIIFINKIDQDGINLNNIYQNIKENFQMILCYAKCNINSRNIN